MDHSGRDNHMSSTEPQVIPCNYCNRKFTSPRGLLSHLQAEKALFTCDNCSIEFTNQCAFKYHILICLEKNKNIIREATEDESNSSLNLPTLLTATNSSNGDNQAIAATNKSSHSETKRQKTEKHNSESRAFSSSIEKPNDKDRYSKEDRLKFNEDKLVSILLNNENQKVCPVCNKVFEDSSYLKIHSRSHGNVFLTYCEQRIMHSKTLRENSRQNN